MPEDERVGGAGSPSLTSFTSFTFADFSEPAGADKANAVYSRPAFDESASLENGDQMDERHLEDDGFELVDLDE